MRNLILIAQAEPMKMAIGFVENNNELMQPANGGEVKPQKINPDSTPNDLYNGD